MFALADRTEVPAIFIHGGLTDSNITDKTDGDTRHTSIAGNLQHTIHGFNAEFSPIFFDKEILHFRKFAIMSRPFWRMVISSACSSSCHLRRLVQQTFLTYVRKRKVHSSICCAGHRHRVLFIQAEFSCDGYKTGIQIVFSISISSWVMFGHIMCSRSWLSCLLPIQKAGHDIVTTGLGNDR